MKTWTVVLGSRVNGEHHQRELEKAKIQVVPLVQDMGILPNAPLGRLRVVQFPLSELMGQDGLREEIPAKVIEAGFSLCPPRLVHKLRLVYQDQPHGEISWLAMDPLEVNNRPHGLCLTHQSSKLWIGAYVAKYFVGPEIARIHVVAIS